MKPRLVDIVGWVALGLTLVGVAMVQLYGGWGYLVAIPALVLLLVGIFAMQMELRRR